MSDASMLKEFLVGIGFSVDTAGKDKFDKAVQGADKSVQGLGKGLTKAMPAIAEGLAGVVAMGVVLGEVIVKAAEAVVKAVVEMAKSLDQLYFTSRRVGASGEEIKSFTYALGQMGGSAQEAQGMLEGMASAMRQNPFGMSALYAQNLGVRIVGANGKLRDMVDIIADVGKSLNSMPKVFGQLSPQALQIAEMLGISEKKALAITADPDKMARDQKAYNDFAKSIGMGSDSGAKAANDFMESLRLLKNELGLLVIAAASKLLPVFKAVVDWFVGALHLISGVRDMFAGLADQFAEFRATHLGKEFDAVGAAVGQVIDAVTRLGAIIGRFLASGIGAGLMKIVDDLAALGSALSKFLGPAFMSLVDSGLKLLIDALHIVSALISGIADLLTGKWGAAWKDAKAGVGGFLDTFGDMFKGAGNFWHELLDGGHAKPDGANDNSPAGSAALPTLVKRGTTAARSTLEQVRAFFIANGFSGEQARGIEAGVSAEGGDVNARNPTSGAFGIGQWLGSRKRELFAEFGPNPNLAQQLQFMLQELRGGDRGGAAVRNAVDAMSTMGAYVQSFMRPGAGTMGDLDRGSRFLGSQGPWASAGAAGAPSFNQKTEINISGSHDPERAGRVVADSQDRVNGNLIRNLKTAFA